jgi:glutamate-5-semialdehyde dehydrogenase
VTIERLTSVEPGMPIVWGGNNVSRVSDDLAAAFGDGDSLIVMQHSGELLHIPREAQAVAQSAVAAAATAFGKMGAVSDDQITRFYLDFAANLADDIRFTHIADANAEDISSAHSRGRSTTRLVLDDRMRAGMIDGLNGWAEAPSGRGRVQGTIEHDGWTLDHVVDGLGVIGFVFEGRPNVFADATGVLRGGNTVVFRIGSDALGTARAIVTYALAPALESSGLPAGAASLVASPSRASAWAMMADPQLSLAVARGSGAATTQLGAVARQAGNAVSLHGTGGGWIVAGPDADPLALGAAVFHSLDRKVCNTVNTVCIPEKQAADLVPAVLHALERAGERLDTNAKLHVLDTSAQYVPDEWFGRVVPISRAGGMIDEASAETLVEADLGEEWEWEQSPEVTLAVVRDVDHAVDLFNRYSPRFVVSLISDDAELHKSFFAGVDSPFVGNGFTRWVDGQYALNRPELGLSNWQAGRLFGRSGILSGDSAYSIRLRVTQDDPDIGR